MSLDVISSEVTTDTDKFIKGLCDRYLQNPVVYNDLLDRRVGGDKFGQLGLVKGHGGCFSEPEGMNRTWNMLRGKLDNIMNVSKKIDIQDVLKHNDDNSPMKVVVDGPPGVGKTTLCQKLCSMWAKNELEKCSLDLVFLISLRDEEASSAKNISDLVSLFHSDEEICDNMSKKIKQTNGKDMLLIFDGWDEFKGRDQNRSFILDIIQGRQLHKCNVLVTSRTYASAKLLQLQSVNRHVEVLGFEEEEIFSYIRNELTEENAKQLIKELEIREDVLSLCYIPFVCSMLVRVYQLSDYILPNTLTKFYKKYVLYAVKRSMKKQEVDPDTVESLEELQEDQKRAFDELCCCAYEKLKTQNTTFNRNEILKLSHSLKCEHFGLMNCYKIADTTKHQFLHLTIQEFLAAWWITHHDDQRVKFKEHFQDSHFRMTLRFVAGLTELKDDSYQEYFSKEVDLQCVREPLFDTVHDIITYPVKKTETLSPGLENVGRNITNLKSLSLYKPLMPFIIYLDSNPFLQHLDIVLEREGSLDELFNILSSNTTVIALRINCRNIGLFDDEVGKSLQLMLSSNKSLQCLEIKSRASNCTLLIKYLTTGLRRNNTLQELNVDIKLSENINFKEFFEATDNLKSLTMIFYSLEISEQVLTSLYHEEIIPHVTNMLKRNEDMKFLKVIFYPPLSSKDTYNEDRISMIHQFWETVLLHPSLCYVRIPKLSIMIDILNDMKKTLITQRKEKKLGPHPIVEITDEVSLEEIIY